MPEFYHTFLSAEDSARTTQGLYDTALNEANESELRRNWTNASPCRQTGKVCRRPLRKNHKFAAYDSRGTSDAAFFLSIVDLVTLPHGVRMGCCGNRSEY